MPIEDLSPTARTQAQLYALQAVIAALLVRLLESTDDVDTEAKAISEIAFSSIGKFELRGKATANEKDAARAMMEAFASETIMEAANSARKRRERGL